VDCHLGETPIGKSGFAFQFTNSNDQGEYYEGLADSLPFACRAADDLTREPGDSAEGSTAEALSWLGTGACSEVLGPDSRLRKAQAGFRIPRSRRPTAAQAYLPGIF